jgi:hypothetical protein
MEMEQPVQCGFDIVLIEPVRLRLCYVVDAKRWEALMTMHVKSNRIGNIKRERCKKIGSAESQIDAAVRSLEG